MDNLGVLNFNDFNQSLTNKVGDLMGISVLSGHNTLVDPITGDELCNCKGFYTSSEADYLPIEPFFTF
jgi:hypothetical protein